MVARVLIAMAAIVGMSAPAFGGGDEGKVVVDLRSHRAEIRGVLLRHTQVGSSSGEVLKFITAHLERSDDATPKMENGPATGPAAKASRRRSVKRIRIYLGQYYDHPEVVFLAAPMLMQKEVDAQWAFDEHDRLINIFVDKQTELY